MFYYKTQQRYKFNLFSLLQILAIVLCYSRAIWLQILPDVYQVQKVKTGMYELANCDPVQQVNHSLGTLQLHNSDIYCAVSRIEFRNYSLTLHMWYKVSVDILCLYSVGYYWAEFRYRVTDPSSLALFITGEVSEDRRCNIHGVFISAG